MARNTGWVPNQHGAWAMLAVPFVVGTVRGAADHGVAWASIPLFALWVLGYFAFFAAGLWLKSRRRARYLRPLFVYTAAAGACGVVVLALDPGIVVWALAFVPFLAVGLWAAAARVERSVLSGGAMVAAASLMTVVAYRLGGPGASVSEAGAATPGGTLLAPDDLLDSGDGSIGWADGAVPPADGMDAALVISTPIWLLAGLLFAYFFGTVLYVKSMIRARGIRSYGTTSVVYHAACAAALGSVALLRDPAWWWAVAFFAVLTARAGAMLGREVSPKALGVGEAVASMAALGLGLALP